MDYAGLYYFVSLIVAIWVFQHRSGLGAGRPPGLSFHGLIWTVFTVGKAIVWPVVLGYWLAKGRPESALTFESREPTPTKSRLP